MTHWGDPHSDDEYSASDSEGYTDIAAPSDSDYTDTEPLDIDSDTEYIIYEDVNSSLSEEETHTPVSTEELPEQKSTLRRTDTVLSRVHPSGLHQGGVEVQGLPHQREYGLNRGSSSH